MIYVNIDLVCDEEKIESKASMAAPLAPLSAMVAAKLISSSTMVAAKLHLFFNNGGCQSQAQACILQLFQAYHSESICGQVYGYSPNFSITRVTKAHPCSHQRITSIRWSATSYLESVNAYLWDTTFPFERINHARSGMIHQASHQGLQHPPKRIFQVRQLLSEYLNMIISTPLFQESTHLGVAPTLCSILETTSYFSMSLSLLVIRVQVALHL
ncbi:hypothetical protein NC651_031511 [Populus alba x Populus x berolinensis]|nr:hypothetical protein NC651_031511 [Populus alba x Populus x berolinensis]